METTIGLDGMARVEVHPQVVSEPLEFGEILSNAFPGKGAHFRISILQGVDRSAARRRGENIYLRAHIYLRDQKNSL